MTSCRDCNAPVLWCDTTRLARIALDPEPVDDGRFVVTDHAEWGPAAFPVHGCDGNEPRFRRHVCGGAS